MRKPRPLLEQEEFDRLAADRDVDALIDALAQFVKAKSGRKTQYASPAERAKAYRQRQRAELDRLRGIAERAEQMDKGEK